MKLMASGQVFMGAITEGWIFGVFTLAQGDCFLFSQLEGDGRQAGSFMGTVAKGLILGTPTGTPVVRSGFKFENRGDAFSDNRFIHRSPPGIGIGDKGSMRPVHHDGG